jgi:hypothetical protein
MTNIRIHLIAIPIYIKFIMTNELIIIGIKKLKLKENL